MTIDAKTISRGEAIDDARDANEDYLGLLNDVADPTQDDEEALGRLGGALVEAVEAHLSLVQAVSRRPYVHTISLATSLARITNEAMSPRPATNGEGAR